MIGHSIRHRSDASHISCFRSYVGSASSPNGRHFRSTSFLLCRAVQYFAKYKLHQYPHACIWNATPSDKNQRKLQRTSHHHPAKGRKRVQNGALFPQKVTLQRSGPPWHRHLQRRDGCKANAFLSSAQPHPCHGSLEWIEHFYRIVPISLPWPLCPLEEVQEAFQAPLHLTQRNGLWDKHGDSGRVLWPEKTGLG